MNPEYHTLYVLEHRIVRYAVEASEDGNVDYVSGTEDIQETTDMTIYCSVCGPLGFDDRLRAHGVNRDWEVI